MYAHASICTGGKGLAADRGRCACAGASIDQRGQRHIQRALATQGGGGGGGAVTARGSVRATTPEPHHPSQARRPPDQAPMTVRVERGDGNEYFGALELDHWHQEGNGPLRAGEYPKYQKELPK